MTTDKEKFFIKRRHVCLKDAYKFFGVKPTSYMGTVVQRMYDYYFKGAINLYFTYMKYYKKEFRTYKEYLEKRFNLFPNEVEKNASKCLYYKNLSFQAKYQTAELVKEKEFAKSIREFVKYGRRLK
jgi:hypothetical protein